MDHRCYCIRGRAKTNCFFCFAFPLLPLDQRIGPCFESTARSKPSVMTMYEDEIRSQEVVILQAERPLSLSLCFFPLAWIVGSACATFLQISSRAVLYWFVKVFQHKSFNTASTLSHLDFALFSLAHGRPTSTQLSHCIVIQPLLMQEQHYIL